MIEELKRGEVERGGVVFSLCFKQDSENGSGTVLYIEGFCWSSLSFISHARLCLARFCWCDRAHELMLRALFIMFLPL